MRRPKTHIQRARSVDEYVEMVKQAIFEVEELRLAYEYDMDSMGGAAPFIDLLDADLKALFDSMKDGSYQFRNEDFPFMKIVEREEDRRLPFKYLLRQINETHRLGLDIGEE